MEQQNNLPEDSVQLLQRDRPKLSPAPSSSLSPGGGTVGCGSGTVTGTSSILREPFVATN